MLSDILVTAFDSVDVWMYISDFHTGEVLFVNKKFAAFKNQSVEELIGKKCWNLLNSDSDCPCSFCPRQKIIDHAGMPTGKYTWELQVPSRNMWMKIANEAIVLTDGRLANITTLYDITELKLIQARLSDLAFIDQHLLLENCLKLTNDILEIPLKPSLIVFDIQSLYKINEAYGREVGDSLLISIRDWILSCNIPNSHLYRIGGDEFCLAIQAPLDTVKGYAENLSHKFTKPWLIEKNINMDFLCGITVGIIPDKYITESDSLLTLIESTLKTAKSSEKITIYNEEIRAEAKRHFELELSLKRCIAGGMTGFDVYYQPIVDPITGSWYGLEALCRWNSPELGQVSPLMFIPQAERLTLIGAIGLWVLETSVKSCKLWGLDKLEHFILDVNLSAAQFLDELLAEKILKILNNYDYNGKNLSIEITESTQFTFNDQSLETINLLRANNILVALDDFGTGYSSFHNLKNLPVDVLKIERAFITNIENDCYQQYLFRAMVELAHAVNMKLIVEGVESQGQMRLLQKSGADLMQGFLFSRPLAPHQLEASLNHFS